MPDTPLTKRILQERGLLKVKERKPGKHRDSFGKFVPIPRPVVGGKSKTALMKYLEEKYHVAMEEVLLSGSLSIVAKKLGNEVDVTTLSRWIKRMSLRYTEKNLPDCKDCNHWTLACNGGVCSILMQMELYDLMFLKRRELLEGKNANQG